VDEPDRKFVSNEEAQATVRRFALIPLAIGFAAAYWVWPAGIADVPLAAVTFGALMHAIGSGLIVLATLVVVAMLWF
jgi:hypothetical protein